MIIGADQTNSYSSSLVITLVLGWIVFRADEGNRLGVAGISVGMVDHEKAAPSPCKYRSRRRDYPQGKQREETGLAGKRADSAHPKGMAPAGQTPEPRATRGFAQRKRAWRLSRPLVLVEVAGIEPASDNLPSFALHA